MHSLSYSNCPSLTEICFTYDISHSSTFTSITSIISKTIWTTAITIFRICLTGKLHWSCTRPGWAHQSLPLWKVSFGTVEGSFTGHITLLPPNQQQQSTEMASVRLVGQQEEHPDCKNWVMRYWCGYLSGARCKWFVYVSSWCTATPSSLAAVKSRMVYLSGAGLPMLSWKRAVKWM